MVKKKMLIPAIIFELLSQRSISVSHHRKARFQVPKWESSMATCGKLVFTITFLDDPDARKEITLSASNCTITRPIAV